ncbi:MAG: hypothetical protein ACXWT0_00060 [Methylobacter sp.]
MSHESHHHKITHETWIATTLRHVNDWRKSNELSRESIVSHIEEAHERINGPARMGIRFEPKSADIFERMRANATKVYRWLNDDSKDTNLLTLNFTESILAAMPTDVAMNWLNELLTPHGFVAKPIASAQQENVDIPQLQSLIKEFSEAQCSAAGLIDGAGLSELHKAQGELSEAIAAAEVILRQVEAAIVEHHKHFS